MERQVEGQRGLELRISNAVFSKLIKMGRDQGMTPQRVGQALFDQAYETACLAKGKPATAEAVPDQADLAELRAALKEAEQQRDFYKSEMTECREAQLREANDMDGVEAALRTARAERDQAQKTIASKDTMLLDQARQIREAHAEIEQLQQRILEGCTKVPFFAPEVDEARLKAACIKPGMSEIGAVAAEPAIERLGPIVPVRAIKGMNAAGNSPAEIARDLGLDVAIVRQVL